MGREDSRLTLEGLAKRLEALERENAELRHEVATLEGSGKLGNEPAERNRLVPLRDGERASGFEGRVSRRALLAKAGAAAAVAVAAGTLLTPREAKTAPTGFSEYVTVQTQNGENNTDIGNGAYQAAVYARNRAGGTGVIGETDDPRRVGVFGYNPRGDGVMGETYRGGYSGVYGRHSGTQPGMVGFGVTGWGTGRGGAGVLGRNQAGDGVWGQTDGNGVSGVYGQHTGPATSFGFGVTRDGRGRAGAGVLGRS